VFISTDIHCGALSRDPRQTQWGSRFAVKPLRNSSTYVLYTKGTTIIALLSTSTDLTELAIMPRQRLMLITTKRLQ